ncbi:uncharacterized protein ARMOST_06232 [Armillaria ostoyae]|uniref:Uncharacterized protein n=1 Tax=Armillaria ostoyae TaxID=47428 RepID=A0A284R2D8_ARMOS|nr:uncharacterized protein ARMOST_06232 [Armillaria ostoyae]
MTIPDPQLLLRGTRQADSGLAGQQFIRVSPSMLILLSLRNK